MTGTPANVLFMDKMEDMKVIISYLKYSLETIFNTKSANEIDSREVGGSAYAQSKDITTKLDTLLLRSTELSSSEP